MWSNSRYMLLRLFVKMNVYMMSVLVCSIASIHLYNLAIRIFGYPRSLVHC